MATTKFKCIKPWARNKVGDIVMDWEFRRYPKPIQQKHFRLVETVTPTAKAEPKKKVVEVKVEEKPKVIEKPEQESINKFTPKTTLKGN